MHPVDQHVDAGHHLAVDGRDDGGVVAGTEQRRRRLVPPGGDRIDRTELPGVGELPADTGG
jgi:hypothetical protein